MQPPIDPQAREAFLQEATTLTAAAATRLENTPENAAKGMAQLVLTLIELLRKLMEKQAIRRLEAGSLSDEEAERVGQTFMLLEEKMAELRKLFDLEEEDLNLNLGPLGKLM